ncbi:MAG: SpoIIE family protein phosphatase [Acidimicrobiales bacterium]
MPARLVPLLTGASGLEDGPELLGTLAESLGWDLAMLWVLDRGAGRLGLRATWPENAEPPGRVLAASRRASFAVGQDLPGRVWARLAPYWVADLATDRTLPRSADAAADGLTSAVGFPVTNGGRFLGVVELWSRRPRPKDPSVRATMVPIGAGMGQLLERWQAEAEQAVLNQRLAFLAEASQVLAGSLDLEETLGRLAQLVVPHLADWCAVHVLEASGTLKPLAVAHADPSRTAMVQMLQQRYPMAEAGGVNAAVRSGEPLFYESISDDDLAAVATDEDHLALLRSLDLHSALYLPLTAHGRTLGALSLATETGRHMTAADRSLSEELARRAAQAIDNARLYREMEQATQALRFQTALLTTQAEAGLEGMMVVSPQGEMLSFNRRFAEMWGIDHSVMSSRSDEQALARAMEQVVDPEAFLSRVKALYADPVGSSRDEVAFKDGRVFDRYGAPLRAEDGHYLGWAWYFRDITDRKRAEEQLLESGERFASLARTLQQSLLPPDLPEVPGVVLAARYRPAGTGLEVGGDFYDVFRIGRGSWGVVMGDVCGKGASAASLTALARYTVRAGAMQSNDPARVLSTLNQAMYRQAALTEDQADERFATVVYAAIRRTRQQVLVKIACGGHSPPLLVRADATVTPAGTPGSLLGLFRTVELSNTEVELYRGDALVLFTDGVTEAPGPGGEFGEDRLAQVLAGCAGAGAMAIAAAVEEAAMEHQGEVSRDDMAVLVISVPA